MKAIYIERYGGPEVLQFGECPRPVPKPGQVLIEVHAASVNPRDWLLREGRYVFRHLVRGFPLVLGSDVSGVVVEVGADVKGFKPGDCVFGMQTPLGKMGGYAQYMAISERALARKPECVSHEEAAAAPCAALTAYRALVEIGRAKSGSNVLIVGASGGVGSYAVQIAKGRGATVTAVTSASNMMLVRSLGADRVIDYKTERFTDVIQGQDIVFDTIGRESLTSCRPVLAPGGRYVTTIPNIRTAMQSALSRLSRLLSGGRTPSAHVVLVQANGEQLEQIAALMEQRRLRSVIDTVYPLHDARKAHEKSRTWRTRGKLVLSVRTGAQPGVAGDVPLAALNRTSREQAAG
jgi:NADPH:quinone reductase-like Zn-dependent oxidoreductase